MNIYTPVNGESLTRFNQIVEVLMRYGLADFVSSDTPDFLKEKFVGPNGENLPELSIEARIRMAITELGPTYIKFGQMMSTRADIVGTELAKELSSLQTRVPGDSAEVALQILETELNMPVEKAFASFSPVPLSSASIGQVHEAKLHDGTYVVVKIQHLAIEEKIKEDLKILMYLAEMAENHSSRMRRFRPKALASEFRKILLRELDFNIERQNLEIIRQNFQNNPYLLLPKSYADLSTRRVLTMQKLEGFNISEVENLSNIGFDTTLIALEGANVFLDMIFRDGIYHADPHPGNFLILFDGRVALLDFGKVERIDDRTREQFEDIAYAFVSKDTTLLTDELLKVCEAPIDLDKEKLALDISRFVHERMSSNINDFDMKEMIVGCLSIIRNYDVIVPPKVNTICMVLVQLEGTSSLLDASFDLFELLEKYRSENLYRRFTLSRLKRRFYHYYKDWENLLGSLPRDINIILERIQSGKLYIQLELNGLDRPVNRLVYGIIVASLIIGSAMLWSSNVPPTVFGYSIIGVVGTMLSFLLGLFLVRKIVNSGGLD